MTAQLIFPEYGCTTITPQKNIVRKWWLEVLKCSGENLDLEETLTESLKCIFDGVDVTCNTYTYIINEMLQVMIDDPLLTSTESACTRLLGKLLGTVVGQRSPCRRPCVHVW